LETPVEQRLLSRKAEDGATAIVSSTVAAHGPKRVEVPRCVRRLGPFERAGWHTAGQRRTGIVPAGLDRHETGADIPFFQTQGMDFRLCGEFPGHFVHRSRTAEKDDVIDLVAA